jgi:hypothetical protein
MAAFIQRSNSASETRTSSFSGSAAAPALNKRQASPYSSRFQYSLAKVWIAQPFCGSNRRHRPWLIALRGRHALLWGGACLI